MKRTMINELNNRIGENVLLSGWIFKIRDLKSIQFIVLRDRTGYVQCVIDKTDESNSLTLESAVTIYGKVVSSKNNINPFEIQVESIKVLNPSINELPIELNKESLDINLDTMLNNRILSLRHQKNKAIFMTQNIVVEAFRQFFMKEGFHEIFTPKIVSEGAEGGTEVFEVKYFDKKAFLAQSPQFYKQLMVGAGFERVFEIGHAYRAEQHSTRRHLNEYVSLDIEVGFISDEMELMDIEESFLKYLISELNKNATEYFSLLGAVIPEIPYSIPRISHFEAIEILLSEFSKIVEKDIDTEGEQMICEYFKRTHNSEFVFIYDYPRSKRPMYTMRSGEKGTKSFDLLFRGLEITTGGQRIHLYDELVEGLINKGYNPENFHSYLNAFKYGMPPHGGFAIGLERITCQLLGLENIREATLIARDRTRLIP